LDCSNHPAYGHNEPAARLIADRRKKNRATAWSVGDGYCVANDRAGVRRLTRRLDAVALIVIEATAKYHRFGPTRQPRAKANTIPRTMSAMYPVYSASELSGYSLPKNAPHHG
jgi:hypothetical protein